MTSRRHRSDGRSEIRSARRSLRNAGVALVVAAVAVTIASPASAAEASARRVGVRTAAVATGLNGPSAFTFAPNGRIWYLERGTGRVRILNPGTGAERTFFTITNVDGNGERGALGIALHPDYPARPFVYVYATRTQDGRLWNQLMRIRAVDGNGEDMKVLLRSPVSTATNHNGGRILVGPDEKLWIVDGDNADPTNAQDRSRNLRGKMLRVNLDGSVPSTNPFDSPIYSFGHRNSYGFTFDPETDRLWQTENGPSCNDEINLIVKGGNFAWGPNWQCPPSPSATDTNRDGPSPRRLPRHRFVEPIGITGAAFCDGCGLGARRNGDLLFGAVNDGRIRAMNVNAARTDVVGSIVVLGRAAQGIHSMEVGPGGRIYISTADAIYRLTKA
jgi:glucose/arabinose dehydrogenase